MSKQNANEFARLSRPEQKKIKPVIEEIMPKFLDGDMKKNALDFVAYLRIMELNPVWHSLNTWRANCKSEPFIFIKLCVEGDECGRPGDTPFWVVVPCLNHIHMYGEVIRAEGLQNIIIKNRFYCVNDSINGQLPNHCNPQKGCAGGVNRTILGKEFKGLCPGRPHPWIWDPDETTLNGIKKLLELEQKARDQYKSKEK